MNEILKELKSVRLGKIIYLVGWILVVSGNIYYQVVTSGLQLGPNLAILGFTLFLFAFWIWPRGQKNNYEAHHNPSN